MLNKNWSNEKVSSSPYYTLGIFLLLYIFLSLLIPKSGHPSDFNCWTDTDTSARRVELFDFDINTGLFSNGFTLSTNSNFNYAVSFSSGSSKLYIGSLLHHLHQYDLLVNDSSAIRASKTLIADMSSSGNGIRYLTEGPDNKIYVAHSIIFDSLMSVIEQPDSSGIACNLNLFSINLINSGTRSGLPNFNESYFRKTNANICITGFAEIKNDNVLIFPNPARDWIEVRGSGINEIALFDVLGNLCYKAAGSFTSPQRINVSNLTDGIYFIDIKSAKTSITKKIIKH